MAFITNLRRVCCVCQFILSEHHRSNIARPTDRARVLREPRNSIGEDWRNGALKLLKGRYVHTDAASA